MAVTDWKLCRRATGPGWTLPARITADDGSAASQGMGAGNFSGVLVGDDFGITDSDLAAGSVPRGIEFRIDCRRPTYVVGVNAAIARKVVGVNVGTNKAGSFPTIAQVMTKYTLGGATDLWGATWTEQEIKAAGFGFAFQVFNPDAKYSNSIEVDCIECRVHFDPPSAGGGAVRLIGGWLKRFRRSR